MAFSKSLVWTLIALCLVWAGAANAQSVSIVSGNGQINPQVHVSSPMVVLVRDAQGKPVAAGTQVSWAVSSGQGTVSHLKTSTDSTGQTTNTFVAPLPANFASFVQSTVTATYSNASASFILTTAAIGNDGVLQVQAFITSPAPNQLPLTGPAGSQGSVPVSFTIRAVAGTQQGKAIPNVGLTLTPNNASNVSTVGCAGGTILTNSAGVGVCHPVFGGKIGNGIATASIGGFTSFQYSYKVIAGPPAALKIVSGDHQVGNPGALLPGPLLTELTDLGGNDLAGVQLVYEPVVAGTATLSDVRATTDSAGRSSARVTLGNIAGNTQIRVRTADGTVVTVFNLTVNIVIASIQKVSGDPQDTVVINQPFLNPLVVKVNDDNTHPVQGATVTFTVTSGSAALVPTSAITNGQGEASTAVTAGNDPGPIVITAATGDFSVTFHLDSRLPGPQCVDGHTFWNGAGFKLNWISPGGVATIVCKGLAPGIQGSVVPGIFGPLPIQVANVTVAFDTVLVPIYNVSNVNGQESVTVQVPFETAPGTVTVKIAVSGGSTEVNALISEAAPGIFETVMSDGIKRAVAVRPNGTFVSPSNPALRGERIRAYVTGLIPGPGTIGTNQYTPLDSDIFITTPVIVGLNNAGIHVDQVTYAHNLIGVWEVRFDVPSDTAPGLDAPFALAVPSGGKFAYSQGSKLPVQ